MCETITFHFIANALQSVVSIITGREGGREGLYQVP